MIVFGTCFAGDGRRYRDVAAPSIEKVAQPDDIILASAGDSRGICAVYNDFIARAREIPDCEALILIQDDVEIVDVDFRGKVLRAASAPGVGIVGAVGARDVRNLAWWSGTGVGRVFESRGPIWFEEESGSVDAVDGLLIVMTPAAITALNFDAERFPRFHGYDVDICFEARQHGLGVEIAALEVLHRTKGGLGDDRAFFEADRAFHDKWSCNVRNLSALEPAERTALGRTARFLSRGLFRVGNLRRAGTAYAFRLVRPLRSIVAQTRRLRFTWRDTRSALPEAACGACRSRLVEADRSRGVRIIRCGVCGSGTTWPPPEVDASSDRIWVHQYGGRRSQRREVWLREAQVRMDWFAATTRLEASATLTVEVGSGTGEFIEVAKQRGWRALGVEPSRAAVAESARHGVALFVGTFQDWLEAHPGTPVDAVVLWHVLEHVPHPFEELRRLMAALQAEGVLVLEVPNFSSSEAHRLGLAWHHAQVEEHLHHFSPRGLMSLLSDAGFVEIEITELTEECYATEKSWAKRRNQALLDRREWPPYDLLRAVARKPGGGFTPEA